MTIKKVQKSDLSQLLQLYTQLHDNPMPVFDDSLTNLWHKILSDENHHILAGFIGGELISSCVIIIIHNLTHGQRPYALIENVITHEAYRWKGYATQLLNHAKDIAIKNNCYKIMLMTGSKRESTFNFYERAGFNRNDKTAFIQWLE